MKIDDNWADQFKDAQGMKDLMDAQQSTIISQSKKITELERQLEQLTGSTSVTPLEMPEGFDMYGKDEEFIARYELNKFKNLSLQRSLTAEEGHIGTSYVKMEGT